MRIFATRPSGNGYEVQQAVLRRNALGAGKDAYVVHKLACMLVLGKLACSKLVPVLVHSKEQVLELEHSMELVPVLEHSKVLVREPEHSMELAQAVDILEQVEGRQVLEEGRQVPVLEHSMELVLAVGTLELELGSTLVLELGSMLELAQGSTLVHMDLCGACNA